MANGEKRFPFSGPETLFIVLMIVMPIAGGWIWPATGFAATALRVVLGFIAGFALWLAIIMAWMGLYLRMEKRQQDKETP